MYTVKFLNDEEFEKLPGKDMESKIGVAYPEHGVAFARKTGVNVVDAFTAIHELEHLKGSDLNENYDSENKCYYKGFGDIMQNLSPAYGASHGNFSPILSTIGSFFGFPMLGNIIGGGGQSKTETPQSPMSQFGMPSGQQATQNMNMPNVVQVSGGGAGGYGAGGSATGSSKTNTNSLSDVFGPLNNPYGRGN